MGIFRDQDAHTRQFSRIEIHPPGCKKNHVEQRVRQRRKAELLIAAEIAAETVLEASYQGNMDDILSQVSDTEIHNQHILALIV